MQLFKAKFLRLISLFLTALVWILLIGFIGGVGLFYYFGSGLPNYKQLATYEPPIITRFYANDGRSFAEYALEKRIYVPLSAIPKQVRQAFLSAEDKNFYSHMGIDIPSIIVAALTNVARVSAAKRPVGASTITQQVAKNFLLTDISRQVSYERKIKEAILALRIENAYTKDHILELYLNEIYLGSGSYGVAAAALNYFNKSLDELSLGQAAFLAALPKAPNRYQPDKAPELSLQRRNYVLNRMHEDGYITSQQLEEEKKKPIELHKRKAGEGVQADYFAEEVRRELLRRFGEKSLYQGGLVARTTLDPRLQKIAQRALRDGLRTYDRRHGWRGPFKHLDLSVLQSTYKTSLDWLEKFKTLPTPPGLEDLALAIVLEVTSQNAVIGLKNGTLGSIPLQELKWAQRYISTDQRGPEVKHPNQVLKIGDVIFVKLLKNQKPLSIYQLHQLPQVVGGLVAMDPHTGRVLALEGGYSFYLSQFDRATQALRQPGSAFKTFVYLTALEKGLTPSMMLDDSPFEINMGYGLGIWRPRNYDEKFMGFITLRRAFELSRNTATIRMVHERVGIKNVRDTALRFNILSDMPMQLAMVLGAGETTLLTLTTAYAMVANGGKKIQPTLLERVQDRTGKTVFVHPFKQAQGALDQEKALPLLVDRREEVTDAATAYQTVSLLEGVIQRGTGRLLKNLNRPVAGKSGTTNDFRDAWFIAFSPDLIVGVYIGFDQPHYLGRHESGARVSSPVAYEFLKEALAKTPPLPFRVPSGIKLVRVNPYTGHLAKAGDKEVILEAFKLDTDPQNYANQEDTSGDYASTDAVSSPSSPPAPKSDISGTGGLY